MRQRAVITEWRESYGFAKRLGGPEFFVHVNDVVGEVMPYVGATITCDALAANEFGQRLRPEGKNVRVIQ